MEPATIVRHTKARLEQFSDGVFAIAITLLALELHVPLLHSTGIRDASRELAPLVPTLLTFVLSFVAIAIFWVNHHQLSLSMGRISRRILWTNIFFLLFITLIPFVTQATSINTHHPLAIVAYSIVLFGASTFFTLLRYFVHTGAGETRFPMVRSFVGPAFYLLAIIGAFASVWCSYAALIVPPLFYFLPKEHFPKE